MVPSRRPNSKKPTRQGQRSLHLIVVLIICVTMLSEVFLANQNENNNIYFIKTSVPPLKDDSKHGYTESLIHKPFLDIQSSQNPHILFIVNDITSLHTDYDKPFIDFINKTLRFNVTLHDDNNSYSYEGYDAIVISDSSLAGEVSSLANASIPILIMEPFTYSDFRLATGRGSSSGETDYYIMNSNHYITKNETFETFTTIYSSSGIIQFMKGFGSEPPVSEIESLARRTIPNANERTLITLDKGKKDWYNMSAAERRTFWGATQGTIFNQKGWELWNKTLRWILYDDINGSATVNIKVKDRVNWDVPNAEVNLTNIFDLNQKFSQNTSIEGKTTFTNIPYGSYNLTVEFEENTTFSLHDIIGQQTFDLTPIFNFTVNIGEFVDNKPPTISDIGFTPSNRTFRANISDDIVLTSVNISLTATNISHTIKRNHTMVTIDGIIYFNNTVAKSLSAVNITYNITAIDIAGNTRISENHSFLLGDLTPPMIHEYNVIDYENGTLQFYANITDKQSDVQDPVILRINDSFVEMHLNASGYWVYRTQAYYDITLNYTIWSANDSVGNENGTREYSLSPNFRLITPKDAVEPHIWEVTDTFAVHENGYVEFTSYVEDWNEFQSGTNISSVQLTLSVNGETTSYIMTPIGPISYYYEFTFNFEDTFYYWVNASDLAGNINPGIVHGPFVIDDNSIPIIVTLRAEEWGNGTVDFYAEVIDWPNNETTAFISYTQYWFDTPWPNKTMNVITESQFNARVTNKEFQLQDIWYYVTIVDSFDNSYEQTLDQSRNITVTDKVPPIITYSIDNSILKDGEITVTAYATDEFSFSNFVNNTFYINISSDSTSIDTTMDYDPFYRNWFKTHSFPYEEEVDITIRVRDDSGNLGIIDISIIINDYAPPNIKPLEPIIYQNGTVTIWTEVVEGDYGSGLTEVTISYIRDNIRYDAIMVQNNSASFYEYSISGFKPGQTFAYQITALDKNNNLNVTNLKTVYIPDLTPPIYKAFDYSAEIINHTITNLQFWAEVEDPFGNIAGVNISINYYSNFQWLNWTSVMLYNGSHYVYSTQLICESPFIYFLKTYDEALNVNTTPIFNLKTLNFRPTTASSYGVEFNLTELNPGEVRFWIQLNDTFEEHTFEDHYVTISIMDETNDSWILNEKLMPYNGTHYIYNVSIDYLLYFSYTMRIIDSGVLEGYYEAIQYNSSEQIQMLDYWKPVIHSVGIDEINETALIFWANVSDWGSGVTQVFLYYEFSPTSNGGSGSQYNETEMIFNGSLYIHNITFSESGDLNWFVKAHDIRNSAVSSFQDDSIVIPPDIPQIFGVTLQELMLVIFVLFLIFIAIVLGGRTLQNRRVLRTQRVKDLEKKLSTISNVYTILVSTEVGVPIYTITNVMYQKDETLNDALSGLSVGIDTFLQSFQSDFMQQVQQQEMEVSETESGINIRMSVIEQHQVQVLIAATPTFRIFVFLREHPTKFTKMTFSHAIEDLEKHISIRNLGIVDERAYGPQVEAILNKHFPLTLLEPFVIDTIKLKLLDEGLKRGRIDIPISRAGINSLKRLVVTHTLPERTETDPSKLFDETVEKGLLLESRVLLYNDARNIMKKLLKSSTEQIYEALWIGSSHNVRIIIPQRV
ncbi:MAG: hypothetical protein ACFFAE_13265 [Candidatus Hodarchaeota archaeon]